MHLRYIPTEFTVTRIRKYIYADEEIALTPADELGLLFLVRLGKLTDHGYRASKIHMWDC